jgi:haloalkane dehalogenase
VTSTPIEDPHRIGSTDAHPRRRVAVLDSSISYVDVGRGTPVVFLHGTPTWSYLWRNVIPHVSPVARCLAPDLVGMGESGKVPGGSYRFVDHARYLNAWFETLQLSGVVLVLHDWGSALGFWWAARHPDRVRGIAYMEAIVSPLSWAEWPENMRNLWALLRSPAGEGAVLEQNVFVERLLPAGVLRALSDEEMQAYRRPWVRSGEERRPMLQWPREVPFDGEPADVATIVDSYERWLAETATPKLFVNAEPGAVLVGAQRERCRRWPNQREVTVRGRHFVQEDSPAAVGEAVVQFVRTVC